MHKTVTTLDGRTLRIEAPHVTPETVKILPGEGMPNSKVSSLSWLQAGFYALSVYFILGLMSFLSTA